MKEISRLIINWFHQNKRPLPWREGEKSAYHILLSEIILQQTRIEQGLPYYIKIAEDFPTIETLATADEELLLRYWQGLGYYSRARNLHTTAKNIVANFNGVIPCTYSELKKMKGIGAYTAAAIASIVFDEPVPVVDGNVMRVVARLFDIKEPVNGKEGKNKILDCLNIFFDDKQPGIFNEAIMEFGALQCVPANPNCNKCPLRNYCTAFKLSKVHVLPTKKTTKDVKIRYLNYLFLLIDEKYTIMKQRRHNDIWRNLYEFPLIETEQPVTETELCKPAFWTSITGNQKNISFKKTFQYQHKLTHRLLKVTFTVASITSFNDTNDYFLMPLSEAENKPKPVLIAKFIKSMIHNE